MARRAAATSGGRAKPAVTRRPRKSSDDLRDAVLDAARALFELHGYEGTTTGEVARRADVHKSAVFRSFGSKQALFEAATGGNVDRPNRTGRRTSRPTEESRALLLSAARDLFSSQGYSGTSTKQIAERAGVQEVSLYRYFGNKATLFREALLEPLREYVRGYVRRFSHPDSLIPVEVLTREFLWGLYFVFRENRQAVLTLFAARAHENPDIADPAGQQALIDELIEPLEVIAAAEFDKYGVQGVNIPVYTRGAVALIMSMAIYKEWFFPTGTTQSDEEICAELISITIHGSTHRPPGPPWMGSDRQDAGRAPGHS